MQFGLSESQQILKTNARKFFAAECPMSEVRRVMETADAFDPKLWKQMAEQGFLGVVYPEDAGGMPRRGALVSDQTNEAPWTYEAPEINVIATVAEMTLGVDGKSSGGGDFCGYAS